MFLHLFCRLSTFVYWTNSCFMLISALQMHKCRFYICNVESFKSTNVEFYMTNGNFQPPRERYWTRREIVSSLLRSTLKITQVEHIWELLEIPWKYSKSMLSAKLNPRYSSGKQENTQKSSKMWKSVKKWGKVVLKWIYSIKTQKFFFKQTFNFIIWHQAI